MRTISVPSSGNAALATILAVVAGSSILSAECPDRDGDGTSDIWQAIFALPSLNPADETDGDGQTNGDEEVAGTDPLDPTSFFRVSEIHHNESAGFIELTLDMVAGKDYQIEESPFVPLPVLWSLTGPSFPALASGPMQLDAALHPDTDRYFYRVIVSDRDRDGDGLSAADEFAIGTSDDDPNTGGDPNRDDCDEALDWLEDNQPGGDPDGPGDNLREVDVAFLQSGSAGTINFTFLVSATGTGGWHQLSSWNLSSPTANPTHLHTTPPVNGSLPKVKNLPVGANLEGQPRFVTATIRATGDLFLSSRQLNLGGAFTHHDSVGYGFNAGRDVFDYDLVVRVFSDRGIISRYHVVTPVMVKPPGGGITELRVLSWIIDAGTGALNGLQDSGPLELFDLPTDAALGRLSISHLEGIQYVVTYTNRFDGLSNQFVWVENSDGKVVHYGGANSGYTIQGDALADVDQNGGVVAKVTASGFLTASRDPGTGELLASVWERREEGFLNAEPYLLADQTFDLGPGKGVFLAAPQLTDSWLFPAGDGDRLGQVVAVGDFDSDGHDDAAIAAPNRDVAGLGNVGEVYIINGSSSGITGEPYHEIWSQNTPGVVGATEANDQFGAALAVGDFNGDGHDDLAVGLPNEDVTNNTVTSGGAVNIIYGSPFGLDVAGNALFVQDDLGQTSADFDFFGSQLAAGDFDGDTYSDLAIAAPGRGVGGHSGAGAVYVMWGSAGGLAPPSALYLHQDNAGLFDSAENFDGFGNALATGNLNGDAYDELVIGVPFEDIGATVNAGAVHVLYGTSAKSFGAQNFISQGGFSGGDDIVGAVEDLDLFGRALATGDFNNDGADDLAIGVPGEDVGTIENAGAVNVLYGSIFGVTPLNNVLITQGEFNPGGGGLPSADETGDDFGRALATGDFDGDDHDELIVGAPHEGVPNGDDDAGAIFVIKGSASGLTPGGSRMFFQEYSDGTNVVNGAAETGDYFGAALAAGDFDANGTDDLLVGIPREDRKEDEFVDCGAVQIIPGGDGGLQISLDEEWFLRTLEKVRAIVSDLGREENGGPGAGELYQLGNLEPVVHVASVTKVMTLLLAVEAIEAGLADLGDDVVVSTLAGETGGSDLELWNSAGEVEVDDDGLEIKFIEPGDTMPLRLLLHGMIMRSGNRCSVAIGEHIANATTGDPFDFVSMMNTRAAALGMTQTTYGHPAGGCVTKPQDLINVMREGWKHPLFRQIMGTLLYGDIAPSIELCGTDIEGAAKCNFPFTKLNTIGNYPGRLGWKGGNGRLWWDKAEPYAFPNDEPDASSCTASAVAIVERAGHPIVMAIAQTLDRSGDSQRLLNHGVRKVFTPDCCAEAEFPKPGGVIGPEGPIRVKTFATDIISTRTAVVAMIDDFEELHLKIFDINFTTGAITPEGAAIRGYGLLDGLSSAPPTLTDMATVPPADSLGDYFTANQDGDHLDLKLWRVGGAP